MTINRRTRQDLFWVGNIGHPTNEHKLRGACEQILEVFHYNVPILR